ncbi:MAG: 16S rRNA (guanine(527)-N(7))-methyltransferase RsmG [Gammaproteobacteria bacterium]|nr:16S rRNA (guanine(527)-N(7))-methyltransferase RsmG [Rhodocyclaceae bacterium]MBU3907768.1 16S rRNA (guanine(527)-N(7))-methyltransferase RsmG [Gammaproteobacteria bacterium]MBU3989945.1 16S rRNA (guanine(527)-N(7))-methyltransferase RsmG [Gammaproteobacteria bacterium]MBU4004414.1 16S rRNA (guanine(527)-N(7))-methyltransferase RsmG [Gammaproteobacteria bacterium]MBU4019823.1 16S rRNA (guanine(527)-N(7))-methyltransferase RsmG [Gammaproteobacteria bacterium]
MTLSDGITELGLTLPAGAVEQLTAYLALLVKWNKVYNLTAIRDPEEMVTHHLLDSLVILEKLQKSALVGRRESGEAFTLADVGSGAGLPGLVLAIARPDWSITSIESVDKKAAFQRQVKIELGLANVSIHCGRVEDVNETFAAVISRAFASLGDFVRLAGHLSPCLWAMKGAYPADEITALPTGWRMSASHELKVPGLNAERHLLQLEKT